MDNLDEAHADVLIIGGGPAGGVAGLHLANASWSVVALEQGDWQDPLRYPGSGPDWELASLEQWSSRPDIRRDGSDYPIDLSESDMAVLNFNGVGGGTILYNAIWNRLLPENFEERSKTGRADDWPIRYEDLVPYFERTDAQVGVSGLNGNPVYPPGGELPLPSLPFSPGALKVARAFHARGWHWWPDTNAIVSRSYDGRHPCVGRGTCSSGCNEGAKSSADVTHWKKFVKAGGRLTTGARVRRIVVDADGLAIGAEWVDRNGRVHFQSADIVLMAANGIGTPRLLLASACERFPAGLANSSGLVGKRLMLHPLALVFGHFDEDIAGHLGQAGSTIQCLEFALDDAARGFRGGAKWALHPPGDGGPAGEAMKILASGTWGQDFHRRHAQRFGHNLMWSIMCEDAPEEDNRVVLSPSIHDAAGIPAAKLIYRTSQDSRRALDYNVERAVQIFRDAGARDTEIYNPAGINAHLMGTARMGDDPARSVVDRWCMSHDIPNLGVIDGSVFVTSGPVNPTSTICALALRAAEHLIESRQAMPISRRSGQAGIGGPITRNVPQRSAVAPSAAVAELPAEARARLIEAANILIPAVDDLAAAGVLIEGQKLFDRVWKAELRLLPDLLRALAVPFDPAGDRIEQLRAQDPPALHALLAVISIAYYLHPRVRARINYEGQVARPQTPDRYPVYIEEGLLDHVLSEHWYESWARPSSKPSGGVG